MKHHIMDKESHLSNEDAEHSIVPRWTNAMCMIELNCQPYSPYQRVTEKPMVFIEKMGVVPSKIHYLDSIPQRFQDLQVSAQKYFQMLETEKNEKQNIKSHENVTKISI